MEEKKIFRLILTHDGESIVLDSGTEYVMTHLLSWYQENQKFFNGTFSLKEVETYENFT